MSRQPKHPHLALVQSSGVAGGTYYAGKRWCDITDDEVETFVQCGTFAAILEQGRRQAEKQEPTDG